MTPAVRAQLLAAGAKLPPEAKKTAQEPRTPPRPPKEPTPPKEGRTSTQTPSEPIALPEPTEPNRWVFGPYDIRRTTAYSPNARTVIVCEEQEWARLLLHLALLKP